MSYPFNPSASLPPPFGCFCGDKFHREFLPLVDVNVHSSVLSASSRTTLRQSFINPLSKGKLDKVRYNFPLYDGVTVVGFTCTVGARKVKGVVKERVAAKKAYEDATSRGEAAGLLEQSARASDVFTASIGNVPAGEKVNVEITFLGELEHDAEADAVRLTIPNSIAPRYGEEDLVPRSNSMTPNIAQGDGSISITVDVEMADGCSITNVHSPSHPISVNIGKTSTAMNKPPSFQTASATLALGISKLKKDIVVLIAADGLGTPAAILETHPDCQRRALMTTLVPRFSLPVSQPEVVFVCDRSGSMGCGNKIPNLVAALQIFLKSLPVGVRFNICSFGSTFEFRWEKSQIYDQTTLDEAAEYVRSFEANYGGTEIYQPLEETFRRRLTDMNLEVFLLTDGEIWGQNRLFEMIDDHVDKSTGAIRVFTLGVGDEASSALIQGVARAGNGFSQKVAEYEKMDKKVIRMLKGALTPHVNDYKLEIDFEEPSGDDQMAVDEDFELVEKVGHAPVSVEQFDSTSSMSAESDVPKKPILLYDPSIEDGELEMTEADPSLEAESDTVPAVLPPRHLQAPSKIPTLFPFNRTTVYIMLSASASSREIKSVTLTGTSAHGPLRLEVPVTKLAEKGTTIHQLAARKAIQELEEHGGWLAQAKDDSGKLLRKEFEGQFDKMTTREGVRLGTEYQISGKWCSFVAIEENESPDSDDAKEEQKLGEFGVVRAEDLKQRHIGAMQSAMQMQQMQMQSVQSFLPAYASSVGDARCAITSAPAVGGPMYGGAPIFAAASSMGDARCTQTSAPAVGGPMFGSAPMFVGGRGGSHGLGPQPSAPRKAQAAHQAPPPPASAAEPRGTSKCDDDDIEPLAGLVSLQTFAGNWNWSPVLEKILGVTQRVAEEIQLPTGSAAKAEILATLCAVVFLKVKLVDQKDAWEMLVKKAEGWLEQQTGETAAKLEKAVEGVGHF